ncbi:hypothetical protein AB7C87_04155 [Natrarchaeobius sp. A-rgal3]|uniref:hypothetical protein n=1 Tax=Natrarchaeobius versutus TaxID=1679078 RepID=UPI0035108ACE
MTLMQSVCKTIVTIDILFLLLLGFSYPYLESGTGSYVVAQLTLAPVVLTFVASLVILHLEWDPFSRSAVDS